MSVCTSWRSVALRGTFSSFPYSVLLSQELPFHPLLVWLLRTISGHLDISQCVQGYTKQCQHRFFFFFKCTRLESRDLYRRGERKKKEHDSRGGQRAEGKDRGKRGRRRQSNKGGETLRCLATKHHSVRWCWGDERENGMWRGIDWRGFCRYLQGLQEDGKSLSWVSADSSSTDRRNTRLITSDEISIRSN